MSSAWAVSVTSRRWEDHVDWKCRAGDGPELGLRLRPTADSRGFVTRVVPFAGARYWARPGLCSLLLCSVCFGPSADFQVQVQLFPEL